MPTPADTLASIFRDSVAAHANRTSLILPAGDAPPRTFTWAELARDAGRLAVALHRLGVRPGDRVVQVSENRYEWILVDIAVHLARAVHVAVHPVLSAAQTAWQIRDCEARLVFVSDAQQATKLAADSPDLPADLRIVSFDPIVSRPSVTPLATLLEEAADGDTFAAELEAAALAETKPDDLATILYTSGTTGEPKGVMLSHRNLVANARGVLAAFPNQADELRLCFLPLSHIYARTCDLYTWILGGTRLALAESRERILANCQSLHPTLLNGVPYFFDKVRRHFQSLPTGQDRSGIRQNSEGSVVLANPNSGESGYGSSNPSDAPSPLAELLGGQLRLCSSGGAALPPALAEWYWQHRVRLVQGYGLTEASPVISVSVPTDDRRGSVGRPIPGIEVRVADDGEIETRGPHVTLGYWRRPDETAEIIRDGWLHTGDLGRLDDAGFLWITGRKKELIVTAAGKNIAPVAIEALLADDPLIEQVVVIGEGRKYLTALIVPNPEELRAKIIARRIPVFSAAQALAHPDVHAIYRRQIDERLAGLSENEQIGQFALLDRALSIDNGELTPTLKLRRAVIQQHFAELIDRLYPE